MTFLSPFLADDADALDLTCDIEQGAVTDAAPTTLTDVACCLLPPDKDTSQAGDQRMIQLLVLDTTRTVAVGHRVIFDGQRFVITQLQRDGHDYTRLTAQDMPEYA